jgi:serine phosphatase RsbU (regulator of sigma subunit)
MERGDQNRQDQPASPVKKGLSSVPYSPGLGERIQIGLYRLLRIRSAVYQAIRRFAQRFESELGKQAHENGADLIRIELESSEPVVRSVRFGDEKKKIFLEEYEALWSFVQEIGISQIALDPRIQGRQLEEIFGALYFYRYELAQDPRDPNTAPSVRGLYGEQGLQINSIRMGLRESLLTAVSLLSPLPVGRPEESVQAKKQAAEAAVFIRADIQKARQIQERMLPVLDALPFRDRIVWSGRVIPSAKVSGDFFDIQQADAGKLAFLFCDVSGTGLSAACTAAVVKTSFGACAAQNLSLRAMAEHLNADLCRLTGPEDFAAAFLGLYNPSTHILMYCSSGQIPQPWRISADLDEPIHPLAEARNLLLGVEPKTEYKTARCRLKAGDKLALVSDGILQSEDRSGAEYGLESIETLLQQHRGESAAVLANSILESVRLFTDGLAPRDDFAVLTAEILS